MAIAAVSAASACSFEVSPLREQMHAAQSFDAGMPAPAPSLDAGSAARATVDATSNPPAMSGGTGPMPMDEPDAASAPAAAAHGWMKRLVIDGTQVGAPLSNFPVLVRVTDAELKASASPDGSDIHFVADDSVTSLDSEIERYDAQDGSLVAWVRMPQLTPGVDTSFYAVYQDGQGDRSDPTGLWSDYEYVWHLSDDPGVAGDGNIRDATARANGTTQGRMTSSNSVEAVAGRGIAFDGMDDRIAFRNVYAGAGPTTISAWVKLQGGDADSGAMVISFGSTVQNHARFLMARDSENGGVTGAGFYSNDISGRPLSGAGWSYLVWSWDGSSSSLFIDGNLVTGPIAHRGANTGGADGALGASIFNYPRFLKGQLDEVRVANSALRSSFIRTEYMNQRPDSTFIKSVEAQVAKP